MLWRIVQGGAGAPVVPLSQSILMDTFPRRQHAMVLSLFGMAVGVAPVIGPVLGGYLAEAYSWRWAFYMLVPVGLLAFVGLRLTLPTDTRGAKTQLDWTGFLALATAMAGVQLVLARGVRLDWFQSTEIILECLIAVLAFYVFIVHCLTSSAPFLNLRLLADRNYSIGLVLVTIYGMLNFTPMVLLPPLLQQYAGFPDTLVGQVIGCRGVGMTVGFLVSGLTSRIDPRIGMSMRLSHPGRIGPLDAHVRPQRDHGHPGLEQPDPGLRGRHHLGAAVGRRLRHAGAEPPRRGASVFHLLRNIGSSFFISLSIAEIVRATGANYSRMTEMISPYNRRCRCPG